jgi:hypothetical protein
MSWEGAVTDQMTVSLYQNNHTILRPGLKGLILGRNQREIRVIWIAKAWGDLPVASDMRTEIIIGVGLVIMSRNINRIIIKLRRIIPVENANIFQTDLINIRSTALIWDLNFGCCKKHVNNSNSEFNDISDYFFIVISGVKFGCCP